MSPYLDFHTLTLDHLVTLLTAIICSKPVVAFFLNLSRVLTLGAKKVVAASVRAIIVRKNARDEAKEKEGDGDGDAEA